MNEELNIEFENRVGETCDGVPYRQSIDKVSPTYHPLLFYLVFMVLKWIAGVVLTVSGFRFYRTSNGLGYWYRAAHRNNQASVPLLFYHGIAPGGLFIYLPMILFGLSRDDQDMFCFENPAISCTSLWFPRVLNEDDTVRGSMEAVDSRLGCDSEKVSLCGHSMGTCQITWWLHHSDEARRRVTQVLLLDPVTILLSDPTVMVNFLYKRQCHTWFNCLVHVMASTEIFIEHYIRRHITWYNCELWLQDDFPPDLAQVLVCLSGKDVIIDSQAVREEIEVQNERKRQQQQSQSSLVQVLYWDNDGHGFCLAFWQRWNEIRKAMKCSY